MTFLTHLLTFHGHRTTYMTTSKGLSMSLFTLGDDLLITLMTIVKTC